jgi:hypothetical protein
VKQEVFQRIDAQARRGAVFWARQQNRSLLTENLDALAPEAGVGCVLADLRVSLD